MNRGNTTNHPQRKVIAYEGDGVKVFASVKEAAAYYGTAESYVYTLIASGDLYQDYVSFGYCVF